MYVYSCLFGWLRVHMRGCERARVRLPQELEWWAQSSVCSTLLSLNQALTWRAGLCRYHRGIQSVMYNKVATVSPTVIEIDLQAKGKCINQFNCP